MTSQHETRSMFSATSSEAPRGHCIGLVAALELVPVRVSGSKVISMFRSFAFAGCLSASILWGSVAALAAQELPLPSDPTQGASETGSQPRVNTRLIFSPPSNTDPEQEPTAGGEPSERPVTSSAPSRTVIEDPFQRLRNASDEITSSYQSTEGPEIDGDSGVRVANRPDDRTQELDRPSSLLSVNIWPDEGYEYLGQPVDVSELENLKARVRRTLMHYHQRPETTLDYSPWGVMHALIAYGTDTRVHNGRQHVNAIGWLCWNGTCRGQKILSARNGELRALTGPGLQGHEGQFLAMMAQCYVPAEFELRVDGREFTINDLIESEQETCKPKTELTFKLIAFSHYLPPDATWTGADGEAWDMERLIAEEIAQPVIGAACGGTHRLMGLSYAARYRRLAGLPLTGEWERAEQYVRDYQQYAFSLQNPDGSFSTKWLERREARDDSQRRIRTTGHILEWLIYSLPEERLRSPEVVRTVNYLAQLMWEERNTKWEIGPKGHALHALNMYDQRVFGAQIGQGGPRAQW